MREKEELNKIKGHDVKDDRCTYEYKPYKKPEVNISETTLSKLQKFMCSRSAGGELTEEQYKAQMSIITIKKELLVDDLKDEDMENDESKSTQNSDGNRVCKESVDQLAAKLINIEEVKKKEPPMGQHISRKEMILNRKTPPFLLPENRLDANMRKPDDPLYNPDTLHVP